MTTTSAQPKIRYLPIGAQSGNDTFPTAMHIAAYPRATEQTIPALRRLRGAIERNLRKWAGVVKIGRTPTLPTQA